MQYLGSFGSNNSNGERADGSGCFSFNAGCFRIEVGAGAAGGARSGLGFRSRTLLGAPSDASLGELLSSPPARLALRETTVDIEATTGVVGADNVADAFAMAEVRRGLSRTSFDVVASVELRRG